MAILAAPVRQMTGAKVARRGVNYPLLCLALIGLAIARLANIYWEMHKRKQHSTFGFDGCTRYPSVMAPEDIIPVFEGVYIGSSQERRKQMMLSVGAEATEDGGLFAIWNVNTPGQEPKTARLALEGFPEEHRFRPHGLHYRRETRELFVVNHAYSQGGERIDVFKVSEGFPQDPVPSEDVSLLESEIKAVEHENGDAGSAAHGDDPVTEVGQLKGGDGSALEGAEKGGEEEDAVRQIDTDEGESGGVQDAAYDDGSRESDEGGVQSEDQPDVLEVLDPAEAEHDGGPAEAGHGGDVESEVHDDAEIESKSSDTVTEAAVVEEDKESPTEAKTARLKEEAKLAAEKAQAEAKEAQKEARRQQAAEKAAAKEAKAMASARSRGLSRGTIPVKLEYSFSVEHELLNNNHGTLNDLVSVDDDEIYVTQWLAWPDPLHGPTMPDSVSEYFSLFATIASALLYIPLTPVMHCTGIRGPDISCERLVKGLGVMYNGIALSPNKERLLVADAMSMEVLVFNRSLENGALTLRQKIAMPGSPDNLELDLYRAAKGEEAYTVGLIIGESFFRYVKAMLYAKDPSDGDDVLMPGGMATLVFDNTTGEYTSTLDMWQDGSLLSISSAAATASGARLLGSAVSDGFLLCRPPSCLSGVEDQEHCPAWGDANGEE